jgi:hypothetical protein
MRKQISLTFGETTTKINSHGSEAKPELSRRAQTAGDFFAEFDEAAKCFPVVMMVFRKEWEDQRGFTVRIYFEEHDFFLCDPGDFTWDDETLERFAREEEERKHQKEGCRPYAIKRVTEDLAGGKWEAMGLICLALNDEDEEGEEELDVWTIPFMSLADNKTPAWEECTQFLRDVEEAMRFTAFTTKAWIDDERYLHLYKNGRKERFRYDVQVVR